jgi:hypothetical protein
MNLARAAALRVEMPPYRGASFAVQRHEPAKVPGLMALRPEPTPRSICVS